MAASSLVSNDGKHISYILKETSCGKHRVPVGIPCYHMAKPLGGYYAGVCGVRIKKAGFIGQISETSMNRTKGGRGGAKRP